MRDYEPTSRSSARATVFRAFEMARMVRPFMAPKPSTHRLATLEWLHAQRGGPEVRSLSLRLTSSACPFQQDRRTSRRARSVAARVGEQHAGIVAGFV